MKWYCGQQQLCQREIPAVPSVSEILFGVHFQKGGQIITHLPRLVIQCTSAQRKSLVLHSSGAILCCYFSLLYYLSLFCSDLNFPTFPFSLPSLLILSYGANQAEQVGPRSYRTQVQEAERLAPWRFSTSAKCVGGKVLFCLVSFVWLVLYIWFWPLLNRCLLLHTSIVTAFIWHSSDPSLMSQKLK